MTERAKAAFVYFMNPGYLGDKVVLEGIISEHLKNNPRLIGIEWCEDDISMVEYFHAPIGTLVLPRDAGDSFSRYHIAFESWLDQRMMHGNSFAGYMTRHTKEVVPRRLSALTAKGFEIRSLWKDAERLAIKRRWPKLSVPQQTATHMVKFIRDLGLDKRSNFVTLHMRRLARDPERNLDVKKYIDVASRITSELLLNVLVIGNDGGFKINEKSRPGAARVIDLRESSINLWDMAWLMQRAVAHIGGDSGPTHLATAVGANVITVERENSSVNRGYGPYGSQERVIKLTKAKSTHQRIIGAIEHYLKAYPTGAEMKHPPAVPAAAGVGRGQVSRTNFGAPVELGDSDPAKGEICAALFLSVSMNRTREPTIKLYQNLMDRWQAAAIYVPFRTNKLAEAIQHFGSWGAKGFSVSQPFKVDVLKYIDVISNDVRLIGSANTVVNLEGRWHAFNTDWIGAIESLERVLEETKGSKNLAGETAVVYGTGGAARAICYGLKKRGCIVIVSGRRPKKAQELCRSLDLASAIEESSVSSIAASIFVNATTVGSPSEENIQRFGALVPRSARVLLDVVFDEQPTAIEVVAKNRNCKVATGKKMLQIQAFHQVGLFRSALG